MQSTEEKIKYIKSLYVKDNNIEIAGESFTFVMETLYQGGKQDIPKNELISILTNAKILPNIEYTVAVGIAALLEPTINELIENLKTKEIKNDW